MTIEEEKHAAFTELSNAVTTRDHAKRLRAEALATLQRAEGDLFAAQHRVNEALGKVEDVARRSGAL